MTRKDFFDCAAKRDYELASILAAMHRVSRAQIDLWVLQHAAQMRQQAAQQLKGVAA